VRGGSGVVTREVRAVDMRDDGYIILPLVELPRLSFFTLTSIQIPADKLL
jgi:hypothetical protein